MEPYENLIRKILKTDIELPVNYQSMIRKTLYKCTHKKENKVRDIMKIAAITCASGVMTTGIVYGSYTVYKKIWKAPVQYTREEFLNTLPTEEISSEEEQAYITEEQAKTNALKILDLLGYTNQKISKIELKRSYSSYADAYYMVKTKNGYEEGLMVTINAENGEFDHFEDMEIKYRDINPDIITSEEAKQIGIDFYKIMGLEEGKYEFHKAEQITHMFGEKRMNVWKVTFCQKQGELFNENEAFGLNFVVENGRINLISMGFRHDTNFQDDEMIITKEQAISIALQKEKEYSEADIQYVDADLGIEKMNAFFYRLDNDMENVYLKTEDISRKVWKIKIVYENQEEDFKSSKYIMNKCYFIDTATGEIIGGEYVK